MLRQNIQHKVVLSENKKTTEWPGGGINAVCVCVTISLSAWEYLQFFAQMAVEEEKEKKDTL